MSGTATRPASRAATATAVTLGTVLTVVGAVMAVVMQAVKGDWFPPENSMSQYGVGPGGWAFVATVFTLGPAGLAFAAALRGTAYPRTAAVFLVLWGVPLLLTGVVPGDAAASRASTAGAVHVGLSGVALISLPLAAWVVAASVRGGLRLALALGGAISGAALILLAFAAGGVDWSGLGPRAAWAAYQTVAVVTDVALLLLVAAALRRVNRRG